jgi:hypothetical protein
LLHKTVMTLHKEMFELGSGEQQPKLERDSTSPIRMEKPWAKPANQPTRMAHQDFHEDLSQPAVSRLQSKSNDSATGSALAVSGFDESERTFSDKLKAEMMVGQHLSCSKPDTKFVGFEPSDMEAAANALQENVGKVLLELQTVNNRITKHELIQRRLEDSHMRMAKRQEELQSTCQQTLTKLNDIVDLASSRRKDKDKKVPDKAPQMARHPSPPPSPPSSVKTPHNGHRPRPPSPPSPPAPAATAPSCPPLPPPPLDTQASFPQIGITGVTP